MNRQDVKRLLGRVARAAPHAAAWKLETWGLHRDSHGELMRGGVLLSRVMEAFGSPVYVLDDARLEHNAARFLATPRGAKTACEPYFSYKTTPVPGVLRRLHEQGVGAEVVSPWELWLALSLGVPPERIIYDAPAKSAESLAMAMERGIGVINLNGREELAHAVATARATHRRPRVGLRVVVPGGRAGQFGESIETGAALAAFREALSMPELEVVGLHSHFNGEFATVEQLEAYVSALLAFADQLRTELGLALEVMDFGGNLACRTASRLIPRERRMAVTLGREPTPRPMESVMTIDDYVTQLVTQVERHFAGKRVRQPRIFIEPGRAMTSDTMMLLCRVMAVRGIDAMGLTSAVLDAGISVAEPVPNEFHQLFAVKPRAGRELVYRLTGPSCMIADQLYPAWRLPPLLEGDALAIMDAGAYFVPLATCFSFPRPAIVSVKDGQMELIRRAETFEDLVSRDEVRRPALRRLTARI